MIVATLTLIEISQDGEPLPIGEVILMHNDEFLFKGIGQQWYNGVMEDYSDVAPSNKMDFLRWADKYFDGNYFAAELKMK